MGSSNRISAVDNANFGDSRTVENWPDLGSGAQARYGRTPQDDDAFAQDDHTVAVLAKAIQHEIIPRLMLAHRTPEECELPADYAVIKVTPDDVTEFAKLILTRRDIEALACIESMRLKGAPIESIYLDLLAPAARCLGEMWEEDLCDFTDVTIGLGRLQKMLHEVNAEFEKYKNPVSNGLHILLVPTPGEQHTFGLAMVAEFFQRAGWEVTGGPYDLFDDPVNLVKRHKYDVVGFSLATAAQLDRLTQCISAVRKASCFSGICIMVGGPLFACNPEYAQRVGADLMANDGSLAPGLARLHLCSGLATQ
jgi:MerR family transcriptional regulator, light-induced transcriptional regulator